MTTARCQYESTEVLLRRAGSFRADRGGAAPARAAMRVTSYETQLDEFDAFVRVLAAQTA
jgi:hypothetical protein